MDGMNIWKSVIAIILLSGTLNAQNIKVLTFGDQTPTVYCNTWQSPSNNPDSVLIEIALYDPETGGRLSRFSAYAVHLDSSTAAGFSIDSRLISVYNINNYYYGIIAEAHRRMLIAVQATGYDAVLLEYEPVKHPVIQSATKREFNRLKSSAQTFDTVTISANQRQRLASMLLNEMELEWYATGELSLHLGHFMPSGTMALRVDAPIDDFRRFIFDTLYSSKALHADYAYALSPDGYIVGQVIDGNLRVTWEIARLDGYEWRELWPISFHLPGTVADEFRWGSDGWLFFRSGNEYFKFHVDLPMTQNCRMKDVEISREEYEQAKAEASRYNILSSERTPDAADTAILRVWASKEGLTLSELLENSGAAYFGDLHCLEIAVGDYCVTRLKADTVDMATCNVILSTDGLFAGIAFEDLIGDDGMPAYVYIYPLSADGKHVGAPYIYQITPSWKAAYPFFWGADGWLYIEGFDSKNNIVYHKLHLL